MLRDNDKKGKWIPLQVIDPFTFFAFFNRGIKEEDRLKLLMLIKDKLSLKSPLPDDFEGIPKMFPQRTWFLSYQKDREQDAIDTLWDFAKATPWSSRPKLSLLNCSSTHWLFHRTGTTRVKL